MGLVNTGSDKIYKSIIDFIGKDTQKKTPAEISKFLTSRFNLSKKDIKDSIKNLISEGDLEYSSFFGRTYIEISYSKPVKISERIVLIPPNINYLNRDDEVVVVLEKGVSFGRGSHPTTRLCLNAIDFVLKDKSNRIEKSHALDIGTGSGVLAIAGVLLGIDSAFGCDIDPLSLSEAKNNININHLEHKISTGKTFDINKNYHYVFANLRYPTLLDLFETFVKLTHLKSYLFLSGIKDEEKEKILNKFSGPLFKKIWEKSEAGWVGLVFERI